jgi:DNA invertase Pin-like site-specific DNA recombinase
MVSRLDRLAWSTFHLCQIAAELERKQVNLLVIDQSIDTSDISSNFGVPQSSSLKALSHT